MRARPKVFAVCTNREYFRGCVTQPCPFGSERFSLIKTILSQITPGKPFPFVFQAKSMVYMALPKGKGCVTQPRKYSLIIVPYLVKPYIHG